MTLLVSPCRPLLYPILVSACLYGALAVNRLQEIGLIGPKGNFSPRRAAWL